MIPILFLAQIAFIVAFGVLLDTLVVRSLLVPALTLRHRPGHLVAVAAVPGPALGWSLVPALPFLRIPAGDLLPRAVVG